MKKIKDEENHYQDVPPIYDFGTDREKEVTLIKCFNQVDKDIENMIQDLNPKAQSADNSD